MGFGGFLKKWGLPIASLAAIPFTGGASALGLGATGAASGAKGILDMASRIGGGLAPVLGQAASGRAAGKQAGFNNELAAAQFNAGAPRRRLSNAARGSLTGAPPSKFEWGGPGSVARGGRMPSFTGGFSHRDPRLAQLGSNMVDQELSNQMTGKDLVQTPQSSWIDKALGIGAFGSGILGGVGEILRKKKAGEVNPNPLGIKGY